MRFGRRRLIIAALLPLIVSASIPACGDSTGECCKTCTTGKACGDSCINASETCTKPAGCACNG